MAILYVISGQWWNICEECLHQLMTVQKKNLFFKNFKLPVREFLLFYTFNLNLLEIKRGEFIACLLPNRIK